MEALQVTLLPRSKFDENHASYNTNQVKVEREMVDILLYLGYLEVVER